MQVMGAPVVSFECLARTAALVPAETSVASAVAIAAEAAELGAATAAASAVAETAAASEAVAMAGVAVAGPSALRGPAQSHHRVISMLGTETAVHVPWPLVSSACSGRTQAH